MKVLGSRSVLLLILFLLAGGILGGILGEFLSGVPLGNLEPLVSQHYEIFTIQDVSLNLYILELNFGIRFSPNLLSIIGIFFALFIYRHVA